jgi:hypothetical protein
MAQRQWLTAVALGLVVTALFWIELIFLPLALFGPVLWGAFAGAERWPWKWPVTVSLVAGLGAILSDVFFNHENIAFHFALTFTLVAIGWSAWSIGHRFAT